MLTYGRLRQRLETAPDEMTLRNFHAAMTWGWLLFAIPCLLIHGWATSVPLLVFISVYANVAGHFSAWQAARAEDEAKS